MSHMALCWCGIANANISRGVVPTTLPTTHTHRCPPLPTAVSATASTRMERPTLRSHGSGSGSDPAKLRGRQRNPRTTTPGTPVNHHSWMRSASTSSLARLKRATLQNSSSSSSLANNNNTVSAHSLHSVPNQNLLVKRLSPSLSPTRHQDLSKENSLDKLALSGLIMEEELNEVPANPNDIDDNLVLDVLPSFEMYNALHRHIPQGNVNPDRHDFPPSYNEASNNTTTNNSSATNLRDNSNVFTHDIVTAPTQSHMEQTIDNLRPLATQHFHLQTANSSSSAVSEIDADTIQDDLNETGENVFIDKLYTLPKLSTPIEINIKITKNPSLPPHKPDDESILKEYTSGDTVHGYCTIENKSDVPLNFEMFYVTLEAYTSIIDKKRGKRTVKRFLRMVDLSASWSYTNIDLGTGFRVEQGSIDYDNSILGLNNNRILEPGIKYKKFFMFKLPNQLLDVTCKQEHFTHTLLPPSFSIDKYRNNCKYSVIKVNHVLGCGHLGTKGSPILTYDLVGDGLSINYAIEARIVGKDQKTQKLNIMKEREYNIRFIPFGFPNNTSVAANPLDQLNDLTEMIDERLDCLKNVFNRLLANEPITNQDINGTDLMGTISDIDQLTSQQIMERKLQQLHMKNHDVLISERSKSPFADINKLTKDKNLIETEINYRLKNKSSSKIGLLSGFLSNNSSNDISNDSDTSNNSNNSNSNSNSKNDSSKRSDKSGLILLQSQKPNAPLPYWSPSLLRKTNNFNNKTKHSQENWLKLVHSLNDNDKLPLSQLKLNLTCIQSNNSLDHEPPEIHSIITDLIVMTAKSENSIPITLNSELLLNQEKIHKITDNFTKYLHKIEEYEIKFMEQNTKLNELYNINRVDNTTTSGRKIKFQDFVPNQLYSNIESLARLDVKAETLSHVFKKQLDTLKKEDSDANSSGSTSRLGNAKSSLGGSSGSVHSSRNNLSTRYTKELIHEWVKKGPLHYERTVNINLEYTKNLIETIVPNFESCLCARFYCVKVTVKFHTIGSAVLYIPVDVKNIVC